MSEEMQVDLLGEFRLTYRGEPVNTVNTQRLQSLLAYLALHRGFPQSRQHLAFSFWPDSREKQALSNLRTLLFHLRQALPDPDRFLDVDAKTLTWSGQAPCSIDVAEFEAAQQQAEEAFQRGDADAALQALEQAISYYRGDLLPSCYDEWILPERERLHQECMRVFERLIQLLEDERRYPEALRYAERLLRLDPLREPSYRLILRLHALNGDRASVVRTYQACVTALREELQLEPEPVTTALYEQLTGTEGVPAGSRRPNEQDALSRGKSESGTARMAPGDPPLVGRQDEWKLLRNIWREVTEEGRVRFVTIWGEAGIGKTRLAEELLEWAARQGIATAQARSYAAEGRLAYGPVADWLRAEAIWPGFAHVEGIWLAEVARLVPELRIDHPELPEPSPLVEPWQRQRIFEALARAILAGGRPLMLLLDDVQWCDEDTLEWLRFLLRFAPGARLLLVGTVRTEEVDADHPLRALLLDLERAEQKAEIELLPLGASETVELAAHVTGRPLSEEEAARLYSETEGNPLFVVESVRSELSLAESTPRRPERLRPALPTPTLPPKIHSVLATRLEQLSPSARAVVGVAAAVGRTFSQDILLRVGFTDESHLVEALDELWQRRVIRAQAPDVFDFTHDKLREVAYAEVSPARRRLLHRRIAQALEEVHADQLEAVSARIAAHYEQGGLIDEAITNYQRAAEHAQHVYADEEAVRLFRRALALLEGRPETRIRDERELELQTTLGSALIATRGWAHPDVAKTFERAHTLCQHLKKDEQIFTCLWGLWTFHLVRAELEELQELTVRFQRMAEEHPSSELPIAAHLAGFFNTFFLGDLTAAQQHMDGAFAQPDFKRRSVFIFPMSADERVFCYCCAAHVLWFLGYPDRALQRIKEALHLADESGHPFNRTIVQCYAAALHQYRREPRAVRKQAQIAAGLCDEYGFTYYGAWSTIMDGWALAMEGAPHEGKARMHRGLDQIKDTGAVLREPYYLALQAEACKKLGQVDDGLALLTKALDTAERRGERWIEPELHRLRGELLLDQGAGEEAEACYHRAERLASKQAARSLELRAAMSRSRLWHRQGKAVAAQQHLQSVYAGFTEGHDTPDLAEAADLLASWA